MVWVDDSAFSSPPALVRTWAPGGETAISDVRLTRDHLSGISGLTLDGRLLVQSRERASRGPEGVDFLRHLLGATARGCPADIHSERRPPRPSGGGLSPVTSPRCDQYLLVRSYRVVFKPWSPGADGKGADGNHVSTGSQPTRIQYRR